MGNQQIDFMYFETLRKQLFRAALLKARKLILATEETNRKKTYEVHLGLLKNSLPYVLSSWERKPKLCPARLATPLKTWQTQLRKP